MRGVRAGRVFLRQQARGRGGEQQCRVAFNRGEEFVEVAVEVAGVDGRIDDGRMPDEAFEEGDVRLRPGDLACGQCIAQPGEGARAILVPHDQLGDHRVVEDRDRIAFDHARIDAHVFRRGRKSQRLQRAGTGQEAGVRVFRIQPHFDGMAVLHDLVLRQRDRFAGGDAQLPFDQVQPGDFLGHRMLDLQPGVDFHEEEFAVRRDDEFHRAGVGVVDRVRRLHRGRAHACAQFRREEGRGRFLQYLLVAALRRAFAFAEVDRAAVRVAEHLDLDVARMLDVAFQQHAIAAEGVRRLALAALQARREFFRAAHDAHALAAAAMRSLDHQRIADAIGFALQ